MAVTVFGGTFDPPHIGHLIIAEQAYNELELEKIIFMPAGLPPHKEISGISGSQHRLQMVKMSIKGNDHFTVSDLELKRDQDSYTVDTLQEMKKLYPQKKIYFLIGADSLLDIYNWKKPDYLLEKANFIVARRPDYSLKNIFLDERFRQYRNNIDILDNSLFDISSSRIRKNVQANKSIKYMVLPEVKKYIEREKLYQAR